MRTFIILICFSLFTFTLCAASINGIRIESERGDIIVFIDGKQVCTPTGSCFIANLPGGLYLIEVYQSQRSSRREPDWGGELLYKDQLHYIANTMKEIVVGRGNKDIVVVGNPRHTHCENIMDAESFAHFLRSLKKLGFNDDRNNMVRTAVATTDFTTAQCLEIQKQYSAASMEVTLLKLIYPRIVDKQNFFRVIETLIFSSDKDQVNEFVIRYNQR